MKKWLLSFIMCLASIALFAQNKNTSFYIYRNDGIFNAFYCSEVDSMLCSMANTAGTKQSGYVVQEVHTADSLYRIPLCAIDSIVFATPSVYVGKATDIEEKTAQFEYGFIGVPSSGACHIVLQKENGETHEYSVSNASQGVFLLSDLQPNTTYTYWAYAAYYGKIWDSNMENFTTLAITVPSAITGDASDIKDRSANVECTFLDVPYGGVCGVELTWSSGSAKQVCGSGNETRTITLHTLKPNTTYTYRAFVEANGTTYYGEYKTFTTDLPDISGTWTCTEHHERNDGSTYDNSYSLTLNSDGSVLYPESSEICSSSWSFDRDGTVNVSIMDVATQYTNSGKEWEGTVDDTESPTKITGHTHRWNFNQYGSFNGDAVSFEMTR